MQANDKAPDFTLQNENGKPVSLTDFRGKNVVLYFFPKADTPGCTIEACAFRDATAGFESADTVILGISPDTVGAQSKFADKFGLGLRERREDRRRPAFDDGHCVSDVWG